MAVALTSPSISDADAASCSHRCTMSFKMSPIASISLAVDSYSLTMASAESLPISVTPSRWLTYSGTAGGGVRRSMAWICACHCGRMFSTVAFCAVMDFTPLFTSSNAGSWTSCCQLVDRRAIRLHHEGVVRPDNFDAFRRRVDQREFHQSPRSKAVADE